MPGIVTKTIGVGKDYPTIQAWVDAAPASLIAVDQIWKGVLYKEGAGANGEWEIASKVILSRGAHETDDTRYFWLTAASGSSFADNANKMTNALRYDAANGVAIRATANNRVFEFSGGVTAYFTGLQIKGAGANALYAFNVGGIIDLFQCIICSDDANEVLKNLPAIKAVNCLFYNAGTVLSWITTSRQYLYACTIYSTSTTAPLLTTFNSDGNLFDNAFFGGSAVADLSTYFVASNNATSLASVGFGSANQVNLPASSQFQSITAGSEDFRVKAGAALINNGIRQQTYTNDLDIIGQTRSLTTPTVGAWEYATPYQVNITWAEAQYQASGVPSVTDYSSPMSRGIFRGVARGTA